MYCFDDKALTKVFPMFIKMLYDADVIGEATILSWKGGQSSPKGRESFLKDMQPFLKWLAEAEEEESDAEDKSGKDEEMIASTSATASMVV